MRFLIGRKLETFYPTIRYKMAAALTNWHPSDKSAHKILEPWVEVCTSLSVDCTEGVIPVYCAGVYPTSNGGLRGAHNSSQAGLLPADGAEDQPSPAGHW